MVDNLYEPYVHLLWQITLVAIEKLDVEQWLQCCENWNGPFNQESDSGLILSQM